MGMFYLIAGTLHYVFTSFYLSLIPAYLPDHKVLVYMSGAMEIGAALVLLFGVKYWRILASGFLMFLLLIFITVHIYSIQKVQCSIQGVCWPQILAWLRLLVIHPLLLFWAGTIAKEFFGNDRQSPWSSI